MSKILCLSELNESQIHQYKSAITEAFPKIILRSPITKKFWPRLESYFPEYQVYLISTDQKIIGFINTIPLFWNEPIEDLPDNGWDWLFTKGISDFEKQIKPNCLGGLQVIVTRKNQGNGYSKILINEGKKLMKKFNYKNFIIPIRPTLKKNHPQMNMHEYLNLKKENKIYDPWIRTHINSGAQIINVCNNSMHIFGDIAFWEEIMDHKITKSGLYNVDGSLNPVNINLNKKFGEYKEDNIWISYQ